MRSLIAVLALAGVIISTMALRIHYSSDTEPCSINERWDCGVVNRSPYAVIGPVPVAAIGIAGYLLIGVLGLMRRRKLLAACAGAGLAFSVYLTAIERYVLQVYCLYCVISLAIISMIVAVSLMWVLTFSIRRRRLQNRMRM